MGGWVSLLGVRIAGLGPGAAGVLLLRFQCDARWVRCRSRCRSWCDVRHLDGPLHMEGSFSEVLHKLQMTQHGCGLRQDWCH